jgi:hypothetical protein
LKSFDDVVFNLHPIDLAAGQKAVEPLLIPGEAVTAAFATVRDKVVFTDRRVIAVDIQGIGKKVSYCSLPYTRVSSFCIETADVFDLDSELTLHLPSGSKATFEFSAGFDIRGLCRAIAARIL